MNENQYIKMRITVVSRSWPSDEKSGVSLIAAEHVRLLKEIGHDVSIIGSYKSIIRETICDKKYFIQSRGTGALYSPMIINRHLLRTYLIELKPELVMVEAWQTALSESAVDVAHDLQIPILMISHGSSLHPFSLRALDIIRSLGWMHYRYYFLKMRVRKLSAITVLDNEAKSKRFYDRDMALKYNIPIISVKNFPINFKYSGNDFASRKPQILVIGYFSYIKNQLSAIKLLNDIPKHLYIRFIGARTGSYYKKCVKLAAKTGVLDRIIFSQDDECDIAEEISSSIVVLSTSITEVLPISLIEAMASGTPFVATPVGAVPSLAGGIVARNSSDQKSALVRLSSEKILWEDLAAKGRDMYLNCYTREKVKKSLELALVLASKGW